MVMELRSGDAALILDTGANDWCRLRLRLSDCEVALGAESERILIERLDRALLDDLTGDEAGRIGWVGVRWVLSLSEQHATIYSAEVDGVRRLFFQDGDARPIGCVDLPTPVRREWSRALRSARPRSGAQQ